MADVKEEEDSSEVFIRETKKRKRTGFFRIERTERKRSLQNRCWPGLLAVALV